MGDPVLFDDLSSFLVELDSAPMEDSMRLSKLHQLYKHVLVQITNDSQVQLTSSFSRLSYLISHYGIAGRESYLLHTLRGALRGGRGGDDPRLVETCIDILMQRVFARKAHFGHSTASVYGDYTLPKSDMKGFAGDVLVLILSVDDADQVVLGQLNEAPYREIKIGLYRADRNADLYNMLKAVSEYDGLPVVARLIDVEIDTQECYHPSSIVLDPYYLYDVTSVSECYSSIRPHQLSYILRRFNPRGVSIPITVGNIANYFLDLLIYDGTLNFEDVQGRLFSMDPLSLATLDNSQVRDVLSTLRMHFDNLKRTVTTELPEEGITAQSTHIEPAFYSTKYGIQGRLDLFMKKGDDASIVELKSGSPFRPNAYGLSSSHYHQTLLYDMLIESVYGRSINRKNYILYSKEMGNNLRYAPSIRSEQREIIKMRNRLWLTDHLLGGQIGLMDYLTSFHKRYQGSISGFQKTDINKVLKAFGQLNSVELAYCEHLIRFVIKEQRMSKLGDESNERISGLASMWQDSIATKMEQFAIINHLQIAEDRTADEDPILLLRKTEQTAQLSNYRVGDLVVLYRDFDTDDSVLRDQVFKGTILSLESQEVTIRLRSRQMNRKTFRGDSLWHIEQDRLESGFYHMTRSVAEFAGADARYRALILGACEPVNNDVTYSQPSGVKEYITDEQQQLLSDIITAEDYYLLWGPPGTGKTSVMIKHLVRHYYQDTESRILLLSYTNRAVDEICRAITSADEDIDFIRVGSRYSTAPEFKDKLLDQRTATISNRSELLELLRSTRVYVGTVASMIGRHQLFELLSFDIALVDEASQILDTSLIGLLSRVDKFVLIGDHLQLPAVVLQRKEATYVATEALMDLGMRNVSNSLFERLYKRVVDLEWHHAYGQLSCQGRMHQQLMAFANTHFYNGSLSTLSVLDRLLADRMYRSPADEPLVNALAKERMVYVPTPRDWGSDNLKVNQHEVSIVVNVIKELLHMYRYNDLEQTKDSIGVITPYRAQIASIIHELEEQDIEGRHLITVDTVERYQGGARDTIIMSTAVNLTYQLKSLISPSDEGVDRKLNVAFTRAREQFVLIGCEAILREDRLYSALIESCVRVDV